MFREKHAMVLPGLPLFLLFLALEVASAWSFFDRIVAKDGWMAGVAGFVFFAAFIGFFGLTPVSPNEARVLQLLGTYTGTLRDAGFWWVNPFTFPRRAVSLRIRNFESSKLKVNDNDGNPIEIPAIVVWRAPDTAEAAFQRDACARCVRAQTRAARLKL